MKIRTNKNGVQSFVEGYFDNKDVAGLKKTITPGWNDKTLAAHLKIIDVPEDAASVLEIGCGLGRLLVPIAERANTRYCVGLDASEAMIKNAVRHPKITYSVCDMFAGPLICGNTTIKFAFCWLVCQHVPDTPAVYYMVENVLAVLGPKGIFRCQFLRQDERPGNPLWTYHDLDEVQNWFAPCGRQDINDRWTMLEWRMWE